MRTIDHLHFESGSAVYNNISTFGRHVCKVALLKALQISGGRISVALSKMQEESYADHRGQTSGGRNALPPEKAVEVRSHIASFPKYISHYTRAQSESKYLNADLNLAKMYRLYKMKYQDPVSLSVYKRIFYGNFNLRFKAPKKDTCKKCDEFAAKMQGADEATRQMLKEWHDNHLDEAEKMQNQMKQDIENSKTDPDLEALTYDMQKTLCAPKLPTSISYYLRQLNVYNLGIHVGSSDKGIFHVWLETEASCLKLFIETVTTKNIILSSDSCGGQNRSIRLVLMMVYLLKHHATLQTTSLRYLRTGHTFLPNDSDFSVFECSLKKHEKVYTITEYMEIMKNCRIANKFEVKRMSSQNFFSS